MVAYTIDGTIDGFLTAVHRAYYEGQDPISIIQEEPSQVDFFTEWIAVETDREKAKKVETAICERIGSEAFENVLCCHLSTVDDALTYAYKYIRLGFKKEATIYAMLGNDTVHHVNRICQKVRFEVHRMYGLLRFRHTTGGIFYAPFSPDHNITAMLAPHFAARLSDQWWMIHDTTRDIAALYNGEEWMVTALDVPPVVEYSDVEMQIQKMWKEYFENLAIKSRINPRLQAGFMPRRYWKYLPEMGGLN